MTKNILIIGAASAIAEAVAREYAAQNCRLYLIARNEQRLTAMAHDLRVRGAADVVIDILDADDFFEHEKTIQKSIAVLQTIDIVLIAHAVLANQKHLEKDASATIKNFTTNAVSVISLLTILANQFEAQKSGTIAVITSVAGDQGRQSSYVYSAAKAALSVFLQGLRNRLFFTGVNVLDIKPGFVDTPMVAHLKKGWLWAEPKKVARDIVKAIENKKSVLYTPFFWRYIMLLIKGIPECIAKRGKL